ncbi:MAG: hypothetical protein COY66_04625 [Candidatus Kerfeldbacteria bacterium CG_4_10_14_0_8_um_filter_42_10]|uniref:Transposase IS200-like domain-containing protein n=1 Tax=Candidatus Kerfeldbacteria bacterium CG_4_10_14_0_8_um_filter_42_10 TaxID=2014248 RepID=A0A2M7RHT1_9BACT|nr:MAG: hypothetical protein COY66_04625 [Candidatus Kerfeldbacteria bacterium CG_4_10_14_0_8_um_filter_42_10]
MKKYNIPGQIHFVTIKTYKNRTFFKDSNCCNILLNEISFYNNKLNFRFFGYVIMPNHAHLLIEPNDAINISKIIQCIKTVSAKKVKRYFFFDHSTGSWDDVVPATRREKTFHLWQPNFFDFNVYTESKFIEKLNYIHNNPVGAGLVDDIEDWVYSSWHNYHCRHSVPIKVEFME